VDNAVNEGNSNDPWTSGGGSTGGGSITNIGITNGAAAILTIPPDANGNCPGGFIKDSNNNCVAGVEWTEETMLFTNVSDPAIADINDYLKCFNVTQGATLTLHVDQPRANSDDTWRATWSGVDVGHTFISISQNGITRILGYYPTPNTINPANNISAPAVIRNNENHEYDVSASMTITGSELSTVINTITTYDSTYNLNTNNCTDFGITICNSVGMGLADTPGTWPFGGNGSNPGNLGQDVRSMNNSNVTVNGTSGDAPPNSGSCN